MTPPSTPPTAKDDALRVGNPFRVGDKARWKSDPFGTFGEAVGVVVEADKPIAKHVSEGGGWALCGVVNVEFDGGRIGSSHWSNFVRVEAYGSQAGTE